jgi:dTDP-4-dehydrorhamnose 3,5-epimerase
VQLTETPVAGAFTLDIERHDDERGFFARTWDAAAFDEAGLDRRVAESSISYNCHRGTVRGLHLQAAPHAEAKLVRCTSGAIYDVIVDLRETSESYLRWFAVELDADRRNALFIPPGVAHGFQTLCDDCEVLYLISTPYAAEFSRGVRWDDPTLAIEWPVPLSIISERDCGLPTLAQYLAAAS